MGNQDEAKTDLEARLEEKINEAAAKTTEQQAEVEVPPQIVYGVSVFFLDNGKPHIELTGEPSILECQMLLAPALANINAELAAEKVMQKMQQQAAKAHMRNKLSGR